MKVYVAIVALFAVAAATPLARNAKVSDAEIATIVAAIQSPSTDPATAAILEAQLQAILAGNNPIAISPVVIDPSPAIVDNVEPIAVGPAVIDQLAPITVGPAIIEFPVEAPSPVVVPSPVIVAPSPVEVAPVPVLDTRPPAPAVEPSPVAIIPGPAGAAESSASLVQIILNINQASSPVVPPAVVDTPIEAPIAVDPVIVVDHAPIDPSPVIVAPAPVDPVVVVDQPSIIPDPVVLPTPVLPEVIPEPVVLPSPVLPEPVVIPEPVVLPSPVLPAPVVIPEAVITLPEELN